MPAIRYSIAPQRLSIVSHRHRDSVTSKIWLKGAGREFIASDLIGFICVAGSNHLKSGKLGKLLVRDISNGDGGDASEWRPVDPNEYVFAMVLPGDDSHLSYVITGHDGWPITTLDEFRNFPKCPPLR